MKNGPLASYAAYLRSAERSPAKRVRGSAVLATVLDRFVSTIVK